MGAPPHLSRWRALALSGALALASCAAPETISVSLIHDPRFDPERDATSFRLRIVDIGDVTRSGDETLVLESVVSSMDAFSGIEAPDVDDLEVGRPYVALVSMEVTSPVCVAATQVVGRSIVFEHREGGYTIPIQVGCGDEMVRTAGQPVMGRLSHALAATSDGAVVAGGTSSFYTATPFDYRDPVLEVEHYDIATGRFEVVGTLDEPLVAPAAVTLASDEVVLIGGTHPAPVFADVTCSETQRVVWPSPGDPRPLEQTRCLPSATRVESGEVLAVGGEIAGASTQELWDPTMTSVVASASPGSAAHRTSPVVVAAGDDAVLAFGDNSVGPHAEVLDPRCGSTGGPCSIGIPMSPADDPGNGWYDGGMAVVPCIERGAAMTGAVYLFGGAIHAPMADPTETIDGIFCAELDAGAELHRVGALPEPRASFRAVPVTSVVGRELIVGGRDPVTKVDHGDALLVDFNGCTCGVAGMRRLTIVDARPLSLHAAVGLVDGTILVVGGFDYDLVSVGAVATPQSFLFVPDLEAD